MNICFFCDSIFSFGGVQRVLAVVAKGLSQSHSVTILTLDAPSSEDRSMYGLDQSDVKIEYFRYPALSLYDVFPNKIYSYCYKKFLPQNDLTSGWYSRSSFPVVYRKLFLEKLNGKRYDVIVGVHAFVSLRLAIIRKFLDAPKVVGWMHNSYDAFFNNPDRFLWKLDKQFRFEMPKLDAIVVLSKSDQRDYKEQMGLDTNVIYNPLTLCPKGLANKDYKTFLAVGRLTYAKGFELLIDAFARLSKTEYDWRLIILGDGPDRGDLLRLIEEKGVEDRVRIDPFTKNVQEYYSQASVFVLSSRWEGWGLVITEAMSHGLPVIASDLPVVHEILDGWDNNLLFRSGDVADLASKMEAIVGMDLAQMGGTSLQVVKKYELEQILKVWDQLLLEN